MLGAPVLLLDCFSSLQQALVLSAHSTGTLRTQPGTDYPAGFVCRTFFRQHRDLSLQGWNSSAERMHVCPGLLSPWRLCSLAQRALALEPERGGQSGRIRRRLHGYLPLVFRSKQFKRERLAPSGLFLQAVFFCKLQKYNGLFVSVKSRIRSLQGEQCLGVKKFGGIRRLKRRVPESAESRPFRAPLRPPRPLRFKIPRF